jgi:proteasome lid subunit RPN8/RPN11
MGCHKPATLYDALGELQKASAHVQDLLGGSPAPAAAAPAAVVVEQEEVKAVVHARRGRILAAEEGAVGEPLFGVAEEGGTSSIACCGGGCGPAPGTPTQVAFDRAARAGEGDYAFETAHAEDLPPALVARLADKARPACLPWVRVERDPERYRACLAEAQRIGVVDGPGKIAALVRDFMARQDQEVFLAVLLDTHRRVRGISEIVRGSRDRVEVPIPDVLRIVVVDGARAFIVVHNHPSGEVQPSDADVDLTKAIAHAARAVQVPLFDHVIIAGRKHFSFGDHPKLRAIVRV